ncbi:hypothetical protein HU200_043490 [Digitaria exilis]|uniref:Uncharacterized protein n=1 Tax=Digitaria exilis TaxID=1010633 RepID=A0A835BE67_9POAL|nr:hypothetical protein HU200_043490 [Digitaria exilis]
MALALDRRGIHPEDQYDPYFDLYMHHCPLKEQRLLVWMKFALKLHDAGLVEAECCIITWVPGLSGCHVDFTVEMTKILEFHPSLVVCLRLDDSAFLAPESTLGRYRHYDSYTHVLRPSIWTQITMVHFSLTF